MSAASGSGLRARATAAQLRLVEAAQRAVDQDEVSAIENARSRAERIAASLSEALSTRTVLVQEGLEVSPLPASHRKGVTDSRKALKTARAAFTVADTRLTNRLNGESVGTAFKQAEAAASAVTRVLNEAVESERVRLRPSDLDKPIPEIPGKSHAVQRLKNLRRVLDAPVAAVPAADLPDHLIRLRDAALTWTQSRPALDAEVDRLPPQIKAFVEAASSQGGAPWALVTAEVRAWLDVDDNGDAYRTHRS